MAALVAAPRPGCCPSAPAPAACPCRRRPPRLGPAARPRRPRGGVEAWIGGGRAALACAAVAAVGAGRAPGAARGRLARLGRACGPDPDLPGENPKVVVAVSGKRKTGKDYFYDLLVRELNSEVVETRRFATPIKRHFAEQAGIELADLETPGPLKEQFRASFYEYDLAERAKDPFVFAREVLKDVRRRVLVISDLRQIGDYDYLQRYYSDRLILIRLDASEELRATRGYQFTPGVDDTAVECDLDDDRVVVPWTLRWENDGDDSKWPGRLRQVVEKIDSMLY